MQSWVETSFVKRVAEAALEELVRRAVNIFIAGIPEVCSTSSARPPVCLFAPLVSKSCILLLFLASKLGMIVQATPQYFVVPVMRSA